MSCFAFTSRSIPHDVDMRVQEVSLGQHKSNCVLRAGYEKPNKKEFPQIGQAVESTFL
jgi:hypothetical protein